MSPMEAIVLALVQGVTEFLPISSSAHLILVPYVLGWDDHDLTFDVVTHAGSLLAAVVYFRGDLRAVVERGLESLVRRRTRARGRGPTAGSRPGLGPALVVATIPVAVLGLVLHGWIATEGRRPEVIAAASIGFGLLLGWADRTARRTRKVEELTWADSVWLGLAQAVALIPGTSRSGITLTAGLWRGLKGEEAARFSFLMAVPVLLLAFAKDVFELVVEGAAPAELAPLVLGFSVAAVSAYLTIGALLAWLARQGLTVFVIYRVLLGVSILLLAARGI